MAKTIDQMSDEEISALTPEQFEALMGTEPEPEPNPDEPAPEEENPEEPNPAPKEGDDDEPTPSEEDEAAQRAKAGTGNVETPKESEEVEDDAGKAKANPVDADKNKVNDESVDYKAQIAALFAPFKANGREVKIDTIEDARQLMSMGANYNKKMHAMKPHLAVLRTLENAKIGEAELNFLIDVHNRVPAAINKLVKDSGIDPMDLAPEKADGYKPNNHKATDNEVELDMVLAELDGSKGLEKTLNVVSKEWDEASKQIVAKNPKLLKVINQHVEAGIYEQIAAKVDSERMLGRLAGLSDLEAYRQVGDAMHEKNEFVSTDGKATNSDQRTNAAPVIVKPNPQKADDSKRNEQKRGVAPVKSAAPAAKAPDFNPLSLSDEEFMKQFKKH